MALYLDQVRVGAIVDRVSEWMEDARGKLMEHPLDSIRRGIIVTVDGEPQEETVRSIYVCYGPNEGEKEFTCNEVTVKCTRTKAAELVLVHPADSRIAKLAWNRLFNVPSQVGLVFDAAKRTPQKPRQIIDKLDLTSKPREGPVQDDPNRL